MKKVVAINNIDWKNTYIHGFTLWQAGLLAYNRYGTWVKAAEVLSSMTGLSISPESMRKTCQHYACPEDITVKNQFPLTLMREWLQKFLEHHDIPFDEWLSFAADMLRKED